MSSETFSFNAIESAEILSKVTAPSDFLQIPTKELKNRDLERESRRAVNLELHIITIAEYLRVQRIPRGLRVPLQPTFFREDKDYCTKFEHILNKCSADLMTLRVLSHSAIFIATTNLDTVNAQISAIESQLTSTIAPGGVPGTQDQKSRIITATQIRTREKEEIEISEGHRGLFTKPGLPGTTAVVKKANEAGGQCRRGTQKPDDNTLAGKDLPLVVNISSKNLNTHQLAVLQKGLSFCPMYKFNCFELSMDLQRFYCNLRLRVHFSEQPPALGPSRRDTTLLELQELGLRTPSSYMPPRASPPVETFVSLVERDIHILTREMDRGKFHFRTNLSHSERLSLEQLSSDKSLIIKPADKGGATVVMDRTDYLEEVFRQLGDTMVYKIIPHNPLNQLVQKIKPIVDFHFQAGTIDNKMRDFLIKRDPITPIFYVLPKIHKRLNKPPGRPIISFTDSVLSPLSMVLEKILTPLVKTTRSFLLDTNHFINVISSLGPISPTSLLMTWDVNSLYTSIVHEKGLAATDRVLSENGVDTKIRHLCADLLGLVLRENYFMFQDTFYAQQQGTAMGANVAPPYTISYMAAFENDFVYNHPLFIAHCRVWRRYIDDVFCIWDGPVESLLPFDQYINNIWPELKFSIQYDTHRISFLDTLIYKGRGDTLAIDLFTKPTDRNCLLHFTSCHPPAIKNSIPKSQFHRVDRIVSDENIKKVRLTEMEQKFTDRGYPQGVLTEAKRGLTSRKPKDNQKRIPFVTTFHPFSGLVQSTIRRHWNILAKSYPKRPGIQSTVPVMFQSGKESQG
ncbi:unnamed protein product [Ranitomeya imitator]|uniref:Reverse transcriptase domain-containing protein n=1 Tax=Ranitomeya imitator TaxID=111125 RepID=A0ABN9LU18_9NEOB|nr:unnamed protein product [Ranitomeya imitator]